MSFEFELGFGSSLISFVWVMLIVVIIGMAYYLWENELKKTISLNTS
jgi:hypothetical protein